MPAKIPEVFLDVDHPRLAALLSIWTAKRGRNLVPHIDDFTADDLKPWEDAIGYVDAIGAPPRFIVRDGPRSLTNYNGTDLRKRDLAEILAPEHKMTVLQPYYEGLSLGRPAFDHMKLPSNPSHDIRYRLVLPCRAHEPILMTFIVAIYLSHRGR